MKTAKQIEKEFRDDFASLLKKYHAELEVTDDGMSYGMHAGVARITITPENYDNPTCEFCEFCLTNTDWRD